jgi:hypothetical protein
MVFRTDARAGKNSLIGDEQMNPLIESRAYLSRRNILKSSALALLPLASAPANYASQDQRPMTANGGTEPYPIPWLDKNGSHNQPAGPNLEPSHIYHFKGRVARCSTFTGMGTDNHGNRIAFGSPTTDYGVMQGEYWAARSAQQGTFTHI